MTDPRQLAERLKAFESALKSFDHELQTQLTSLNAVWSSVDRVWEGEAYREFVGSWQAILQRMREYVDSARKYETFLQERIEALRQFDNDGRLG